MVNYSLLNSKKEDGGDTTTTKIFRCLFSNLGKRVFSFIFIIVCFILFYRNQSVDEPNTEFVVQGEAVSSFYGIMIDAGSTGSRVHVYEFNQVSGGEYTLLDELFEQVKPGLSSYVADPNAAATSIAGLLDIAQKRIPQQLWSSTPVALKATAGLRLLQPNETEAILESVTREIQSYPFQLVENGISIMSGTNEGVFGWMTINILLNHISSVHVDNVTTGVIDLGGGSQQVCFSPLNKDTFESLEERTDYEENVDFFNNQIHLYVHSYLGLGLMSSREAVFKSLPTTDDGIVRSFCFPPTSQTTWTNAGMQYTIESGNSMEASNWYAACRSEVRNVITNHIRPLPQEEVIGGIFFIFSYFFDKAQDAGIITEEGGVVRPRNYDEAAELSVCRPHEQSFDNFLCLDLCLLSAFLQEGYGFSADKQMLSVKKVNGRETSWTLGAMYSMLD